MNSRIFTFAKLDFENGCIGPDFKPASDFAMEISEASIEKREGFERFTLICDGEGHRYKTRRQLDKVLQAIQIGAKCRVFRNAAKGATFDFDFEMR